MELIEARVLALENSLLVWKRIVLLLLVALSSVCLAGLRTTAGPVVGTQFTLVNAKGEMIADLSKDKEGPRLRLWSPNKKASAILFATDEMAMVGANVDLDHDALMSSSKGGGSGLEIDDGPDKSIRLDSSTGQRQIPNGPKLEMDSGSGQSIVLNFALGPNLTLRKDPGACAQMASLEKGPRVLLQQGSKTFLRTADDR